MMRLFVYGTLKRGGMYHDEYCAGAVRIEAAEVWGRLYDLPERYPALVLAKAQVLRVGSGDMLADVRAQEAIEACGFERPAGDWDRVRGELVTLADPVRDVPPIDALEGFEPGAECLYRRVLVAVRCGEAAVTAWTYVMDGAARGTRITDWNAERADGTDLRGKE